MKWALGILLFFLSMGLWLILLSAMAFAAIPWMLLVFLAGFISHTRPWPEMKHWSVWKWIRKDFFGFKVVGEHLPQKEPVIYAVFPHGHYALSHLFYFALNPKYAQARPAIHSFIFWVPLFGTLARWIEAIGVTKQELGRTLREEKRSVIMCPAGIRDILETGTSTPRNHSGFLRLAKETGVRVIPVWCSGERDYFVHYLPFGRYLERFFMFPFPILIWGRTFLPFLPRNVSNEIRFGEIWDPAVHKEEIFWENLERLK